MATKKSKQTIVLIETKTFTELSEKMVRQSKITPMRKIVEYVAIINNWKPWINGDFNKVKNEIIKLTKWN